MKPSWKHSIETMWEFESIRIASRVQRLVARLRCPRHIASTLLAIMFISLYLIAGLTVFSQRESVAPERMQLWLSGGMVLYAIYHAIKYLWASRPSDQPTCVTTTPAMALWIGGGPLSRSAIVLHEAARVIPATATKSLLLCVVLWTDVPNLFLLWLGIFLALLTLEGIRRAVSQIIDAMGRREIKVLRSVSLLVGVALAAQLSLQTINATPSGSDPAAYLNAAIAEIAWFTGSDAVQWMAIPLQPASHLAVSQAMWPLTSLIPATWVPLHCALLFLASVGVLVFWGGAILQLDAWSAQRRRAEEQRQLHSLSGSQQRTCRSGDPDLPNRPPHRWQLSSRIPLAIVLRLQTPIGAIIRRQLHCIGRYRVNVLISFAIPTILSLSPLFTNTEGLAGHAAKQWAFVIGGIALSSLLLAPPALQIDFRRDLKRMGLLQSFPLSARAMCAAMLTVPVAITILFQWTTLALAMLIAAPSLTQIAWLVIAFPALAVVTFALENALFLAFPHRINEQGIAMVVRAKMTFLWKGLVLAIFPMAVLLWATICHRFLPTAIVLPVAFTGSLLGCWLAALTAFATLVGCWQRFDPAIDTPPE